MGVSWKRGVQDLGGSASPEPRATAGIERPQIAVSATRIRLPPSQTLGLGGLGQRTPAVVLNPRNPLVSTGIYHGQYSAKSLQNAYSPDSSSDA
jgi:hypothetical protein